MEIESRDFHDYVFQNGKLIAEFEQMYQKAEGIPWGQDKANTKWYNKISIAIVSRALEDETVKDIHEIGCGLGYFLSNFAKEGRRLSGSDISPTAIAKARKVFENIKFEVDDIRCERNRPIYDLVLVHALFWYVFPNMEIVVRNIAKIIRMGGYLFVGESFPPLYEDFVGRSIIANPDKLIEWLSPYFETIIEGKVLKMDCPNDGPNLYWLGRKILYD